MLSTGFTDALGTGVAIVAGVEMAVGAGRGWVVFCCGLTNFFEGAFGGGVASAFIFSRALCAACWSLIPVHPVSATVGGIVRAMRGGWLTCSAGRNFNAGSATTSPWKVGRSLVKS